ncbi:sensor histidine kinase [Lignipirellula cremea]|uniref:histidine kinase n=1 Tax=Lignipirellula cremea TaxID=2528010 RepID=A0A518DMQ1_9BACT|nr:ATP-binding protein [Lignipirellula cremea]QDU93103.1 Alkaline phosphatase synthesis sensor protein PhoR [Lignipirellula cremea]
MTSRHLQLAIPYVLGLLTVTALALMLPSFFSSQPVLKLIVFASIASAVLLTAGWCLSTRRQERRLMAGYFRCLAERRPEEWIAATPPSFLAEGLCGEFHAEFLSRVAEAIENWESINQQRAKAELKAKRTSEKLTQIAEVVASLDDPVLVVNAYEELVLANRAAEALLGFTFDASRKQRLSELELAGPILEPIQAALQHKTEVHRSRDVNLTDPAGTERSFRLLCRNSNPADENGPLTAVAVLSDVSDRKLLQKRNAEFVASVSHEMKTPLSSIKAYVELLADNDVEDETTREEFLDVINNQADRLQRLIDNLLNMARIEAGVVNVNKQKQSLNELLEEAFGVVQPSADQKKIQLKTDLSPLYLGALADRDMLLQSAINLLSNAIKYTPEGGHVTLRSRLTESGVEFEVEDSGVGLSQEDCLRVFDKFYRVARDRNMAPGTGLGLPLARHIIEEVHGGQLTVSSQLGKGSTFRISLPPAGSLSA